jgi:hypothetical protein
MKKIFFFRFLTAIVIFAISILFFVNSVKAMPVGTLLYRTSADGELYGYNTDKLLKEVELLENGNLVKFLKINCGHVGIYAGKNKQGEDTVLEAVDNGVQLTPAKYFVNIKNKEKFIGAKIPKNFDFNFNEDKLTKITEFLGNQKLQYDFGFESQKGPGSEQWICVGLTEKIYESLSLKDNIDKLDKLQYDPKKYFIDITPDGFNDSEIYNQKSGDVFSRTTEYSKIARRSWELGAGYWLGKKNEDNRYFFLPYTQYLQPTLKDVEVDIQLESDFDSEKIRGNKKYRLIAIVADNASGGAISKTGQAAAQAGTMLALAGKKAAEAAIAAAEKSGQALALAGQNAADFLAKIIVNIGYGAGSFSSLPIKGQGGSGIPPAIGTANSEFSQALAASETALESPAEPQENNVEAAKPKKLAAEKINLPPAPASAAVQNPALENNSSNVKKEEKTETAGLNEPAPSDAEKITPAPTPPPPLIIHYPLSAGGDSNAEAPAPAEEPSSAPIIKPIPEIKNFSLFDPRTNSPDYAQNILFGLKSEIANINSVEKYFISEDEDNSVPLLFKEGIGVVKPAESDWINVFPENYNLSAADGKKTVRLYLRYDGNSTSSKSAEIFLDTKAPTAIIASPVTAYRGAEFEVAWQGNDDFPSSAGATTTIIAGSGIAGYDIDYGASDSSAAEPKIWQPWLEATAATSSLFVQPASSGAYIFFRVRAVDRAGNLSAWSAPAITAVRPPKNLLISEFSTRGPAGAYDEFAEIYNPTEKDISLAGWKLQSKSAAASSSWQSRVGAGLPEKIIAAHGYFLLAASGYSGSAVPDYYHPANWGFSDEGGYLRLIDGRDNEIDAVAYGSAAASDSALASLDFSSKQSAERKASASSTSETMGGSERFAGNGYNEDSGNDFVARTAPEPQNSLSLAEPRELSSVIPSTVLDLAADQASTTAESIGLSWSAPEFANLGDGAYYEVKYKIKNGDCDLASAWDSATSAPVSLLPAPSAKAGKTEKAAISGLEPETEYCFALKNFNGFNFSEISNEISVKTKKIFQGVQIGNVSSKVLHNMNDTVNGPFEPWFHTVAPGENRLLFLTLSTYWGDNIPRETFFAGEKMTVVSEADRGSNIGLRTIIYYLKNPPVGEHEITYSFSVNNIAAAVAVDMSNCDLDNPIAATGTLKYASSRIFSLEVNPPAENYLSLEIASSIGIIEPRSGQETLFENYWNTPDISFFTATAYKKLNAGPQLLEWRQKSNAASQNVVVIKPED